MVLSQKLLIELVLWTQQDAATRPRLPETYDPYDIQIAGYNAYFLAGAIPFYWLIVFMFEYKVFDFLLCRGGKKDRSDLVKQHNAAAGYSGVLSDKTDPDVLEEANRVKNMDPKLLPVRVDHIHKKYGNVVACENVSFGLEYGECFALLGISGAGKTTTFKCLTGECYPTYGQLSIAGHDVTTSSGFQKARKMIGYCPQFDAIFEGLTVMEHLQIYAALKGIKASYRQKLIDK